MKPKEKKVAKKYDSVKEMRKIRDQISSEIVGMDTKQILAYFKQERLSRLE